MKNQIDDIHVKFINQEEHKGGMLTQMMELEHKVINLMKKSTEGEDRISKLAKYTRVVQPQEIYSEMITGLQNVINNASSFNRIVDWQEDLFYKLRDDQEVFESQDPEEVWIDSVWTLQEELPPVPEKRPSEEVTEHVA